MPIRTNRGRAAVYRRLWGWPLRSPRHLMMTLIGVVLLAVAIAVLTTRAASSGRHGATGGAASSSVVITPAVPTASSLGPSGDVSPPASATPGVTRLASPPETPQAAPPAAAAIAVIDSWGKAWVNHPVGMTNAQWLAQLKPYTTDEFLPQMNTVDVANIDATEVTGSPQVTKSFTSSVEAMLPTNAGNLDITAIDTPTGWLVTAYTEGS
ncbi:MAG TPA: hypothetical protein VFW65_26095 [Pseudonocardiaceae bacterium]|nr:hypothetical protein [Pseudonocardiaceae bacterium]